jgi:hypothetical protein
MKQQDIGISREYALSCVGDGWAQLVNKAYDYLINYPTVKIVQVKEKFGGLRIYTDWYVPELDQYICSLETESLYTCELCGNTGCLRGGGWYRTLCDVHAEGKSAISPF